MNDSTLPIGVFDSGMGGLTVLRALRARLPHESYIYLGDTARLPYGTKSADTVKHYATQMARVLMARQIKALVIACNTATTASLSHLQAIFPEIPVIGVVIPGAQAAARATKNQHIAVIATETTIRSNAYQALIQTHLPKATIRARSCSLLVALAEEGMVNNAITREALAHYLDDFTSEDTLLLGCTHFPVFKTALKELLPAGVALVDSGEATALAVEEALKMKGLCVNDAKVLGNVHYLVTDSVMRFQLVGEIFLGELIESSAIELIDV